MSAKKLRAVVYARLSDDEGGKADSIAVQVRRCKAHAAKHGYRVVAVLEDSDIGGGTPPHTRPAGATLCEMRSGHQMDVVIMRDPDRLYRSNRLPAEISKWDAAGIKLDFLSGGFDTKPSAQRNAHAGMVGVFGQLYRETIGENTYSALLDRFNRRSWITGPPYGYTIEKDGDRKVLVIDKMQAKVVERMFKDWNAGVSCVALAQQLNAKGVPSPGSRWKNRKVRRSEGWMNSAVRAILTNPIYMGEVRWNAARWKLNEDSGKRERTAKKGEAMSYNAWGKKDKGSDKICRDAGLDYRIVSSEVFAAAQKRFKPLPTIKDVDGKSKADRRAGTGGRAVYRLSGLLKCGQCGYSYVVDSPTHYSCAYAKNGGCTNKLRIRRDLLEGLILDQQILPALHDPALVQEMAGHIQREFKRLRQERPADTDDELAELVKRIKRLKQKLRYKDPDMEPEDIQAALARAEAKRDELAASEGKREKNNVIVLLTQTMAQKAYKDVVAGAVSTKPDDVAKAREVLRQLVGEIRLMPVPAKGKVPAHLEARYLLGRAALLPPAYRSLVAGAGFEPATFGL